MHKLKRTLQMLLITMILLCANSTIVASDSTVPVPTYTVVQSEPEIPEPIEIQEVPEPEPVPTIKSLGTFKVYGYCACKKCCGKTDGITATGTKAQPAHTIAVDPRVIPYGTHVLINGIEYVAEDCGGGIKHKTIDMFFSTHQDALDWGVQHWEVFEVINNADK